MDTTKTCIRCKNEKNIDEFHIDKVKKDGHRSICNQCACQHAMKYYDNHKDQILEKVTCKCGRSIVKCELKRHLKTLIHNKLMTEKNSE